MRFLPIALTLATFAGFSPDLRAQSNGAAVMPPPQPGILGYLDAKTGAFRPLRQDLPDGLTAASTSATTGKLVFTVTIAIQSSIPTSAPISCAASSLVEEINNSTGTYRLFEESASSPATRSGSTATCVVTIPYSWTLATPTSDSLELTVNLSAINTSVNRTTTQTIAVIKVPASGTTTPESVAITL